MVEWLCSWTCTPVGHGDCFLVLCCRMMSLKIYLSIFCWTEAQKCSKLLLNRQSIISGNSNSSYYSHPCGLEDGRPPVGGQELSSQHCHWLLLIALSTSSPSRWRDLISRALQSRKFGLHIVHFWQRSHYKLNFKHSSSKFYSLSHSEQTFLIYEIVLKALR